jgi:hypothetical protein
MIRKVIAVAVLSGAIALSGAGVASAATPTGTSSGATAPAGTGTGTGTGTGANRTTFCARAPQLLARIGKLEAKASVWLPKAEAREAKATQNHHPKVAARIAKRITRVQKIEARGTTLEQKINAACPGAGSASAGSSSTT